jgi:two-component system, OmpR family, sensor histidine kinase KdpD
MALNRPNPDELLKQVQAVETTEHRGRLKIFFGYAAGVGKTYAMLVAARREKSAGIDVVVGYVEPHGRVETESLLDGLETIPTQAISYRNVSVNEFDLDAALARRPQLILVDELAHTNVEGCRHIKRWQDVIELLDAGIDVYSTLNVQHIESLNDVIASITGVIVRETLPDAVLENANEFELIDITPEELRERLAAGKVYLGDKAQRAIHNFFQKSNLVALRELSLRQAANRIRRDVDVARSNQSVSAPWLTNERLLVCVGPSPSSAKVLRAAKRLAVSLDAPWLAVSIDSGSRTATGSETHAKISSHLQFAEQLGAETHFLVGEDVAAAVLKYARERNVSKIVVGKTAQPWWKYFLKRNLVDRLIEQSGDIDIYVIRGDDDIEKSRPQKPVRKTDNTNRISYWITCLTVTVCTIISAGLKHAGLSEANIVMTFLLGVVFVASRYGKVASVLTAFLSVLAFDFFFVEPQLTFAVHDTEYLLTFFVMLVVGLLISQLTIRLQQQLNAARERERRTHALYRLTRQLGEASGTEFLAGMAGQQLTELFQAEVVIYIEDEQRLQLLFGQKSSLAFHSINPTVAEWVTKNAQVAGKGTDTLPAATALFLPLTGAQHTIGAVGIAPREEWRLNDPEERRLMESCTTQIALAVERDQLALAAHTAEIRVEAEELRNSLLSSVSHDLRTPLAIISGSSGSLLESNSHIDENTRQDLLRTIVDESGRLERLVENLLEMTRLESGKLQLNKQWHVLEELVGSSLTRLKKSLEGFRVQTEVPEDLPLIFVDGLLLEQVFVNLLENAARYTPHGTQISIAAEKQGDSIRIIIKDNGPGLKAGTEVQLFDKFFRAAEKLPDGQRGIGLGLSICRAAITAHGGTITAYNHPSGGAVFEIRLPNMKDAPKITKDE